MSLFEHYIRELYDIRSLGAGVNELSYYPALSNLLNGIGGTLSPQVRCVMNLKNLGAGMPDGGLFTPNQFSKSLNVMPLEPGNPERGVIEVKGTKDDAWIIAQGKQVSGYWGKYRQVLVTNLRDFVLLGQDSSGNQVKLEKYSLAPSEQAFWTAATHPHTMADQHEENFIAFLKRVMLHNAPLTTPQEVAWFLASYAREARTRVDRAHLDALTAIRTALEAALGLTFRGEQGDRFFRSTLVQTLFYGVFSAWVLWSKEHSSSDTSDSFHWKSASWSLRVPMIRALFYQLTEPTKLEPLGLVDVLDWTDSALNRVDRPAFFTHFAEEHAVQYFYEPFLEAFDPKLRKQLGIWYTPPEIAQYMVERVDMVLRQELGRPDGLADPDVYVLDPCTGTATYLVEVIKRIAKTIHARGEDALAANDIKQAAIERVFGFEILPAPFVVAHLQLGLTLQNLGAPFSQTRGERASVYLTNALTGWDASTQQPPLPNFPELSVERDAAGAVKQKKPILVILGNPPYNAFAGVSPQEENGLVEDYKVGLIKEWGIKKFNLDDLYVRFFRLAERRIAEQTGKGVVCYISNFSYLRDPSFVVMRQRFLSEFDSLWFDNLNGDSRETNKRTPDGRSDPSIFSTKYNCEGIRKGTAISLLVRKDERAIQPVVRFRQFWGVTKRADLLNSIEVEDFDAQYELAQPDKSNRLSFVPSNVAQHYLSWPKLVDLCVQPPSPGLLEGRKGALIAFDKGELARRMQIYYDSALDWSTFKTMNTGLATNGARFAAKEARVKVLAAESYNPDHLIRYVLRPFDTRWSYFSAVRPLWNEPRPDLWAQYWPGNNFLVTRMKTEKEAKGSPVYFSSCLADYQSLASTTTTLV